MSQITHPLTRPQAAELAKKIKEICVSAHSSLLDAGKLLTEFRDRNGWEALGYDNWTQCVEEEFKSTHGGRRHVFDLVKRHEVLEDSKVSGTVPPTFVESQQVTIRQSRQIAKLTPELRAKAVELAVQTGNGKATDQSVKKAVESLKPVKQIHRDITGYAIPDRVMPLWLRRDEVTEIQKEIAHAHRILKAAYEKLPDPLWQPVNLQGILTNLKNCQNDLEDAKPYAVCCTCQGMNADKCTSCKGRGFISKHHYEVCVPKELKAVREKSCEKAAA